MEECSILPRGCRGVQWVDDDVRFELDASEWVENGVGERDN